MSRMYSDAENAIIVQGAREGIPDINIAERLEAAGFIKRSRDAICVQRVKLGFARERRTFRPENMCAHPVVERVTDSRAADDAFCAAMRAAHPEMETGCRETQSYRSVPMRALPSPVFSSTGAMVP